ncbi:ExbD/TolR family protein [Aeoliella sp. SH292]|uniref:ExbD/TolR family protein n=1 Tax=Aeoliella sp. SH292 TaxID=3454464 RepID=UPI003F98C007
MSINDKLDSVVLKRAEGSAIHEVEDDDEFTPPKRRKNDAEELDMDITPMIDITFLLLIFFIVSSHPDETTSIALPKARHGDAVSQRTAIVFSVGEGGLDTAPAYKGDGKIPQNQLSPDPATREEEIAQYIQEGKQQGKKDVVIKGDRGVSCRDINGVLKAISKVEGTELYLGVMESHSD